jgi:FlaG/FlaF family flagellin (archaellin)
VQKPGELDTDATGVAPVISTILMVAIVVILAAVITVFVLGLSEATESGPQVTLTTEQTESFVIATGGLNRSFPAVTITHVAGDKIDHDRIRVLVNGEKVYGINRSGDPCARAGPNDWDPEANCARTLWNGSSSVAAGQSITVTHKAGNYTFEGNGYTAPDQDVFPEVSDEVDGSLYVQNHDPFFAEGDGSPLQLTDGDTVQVIWVSESGDTSTVLTEVTVNT